MVRKFVKITAPFLFFIFFSCQSGPGISVETYTIKPGQFLVSVTDTGELEALNSQTISAPSINWRFGQLKITKIVEDGKQVEAGELLVEFDKAEVQKSIEDAKAELEIAEAELRKTLANQASQIEGLEADLEITRLKHRISQLNLEKASFESDIRKKEIELELQKAGITLDKAGLEIENQKSVNKEEISKLELKVFQVQSKLEEAQETLEKLSVLAPGPGIAIIEKSWMTRAKYQVDDQLWSGWPLISLPDLSRMQAIVQINEVDVAKIDTAQKALVRLDALPDSVLHGNVTSVSTLARNKDRDSKVKVFDVTILLNDTDNKLMPGMTVSCEIVVNEIPQTLFMPLEALFFEDGKNFVYLKAGSRFDRRVVNIGAENDNYVVIENGLEEGDEVALTVPETVKAAAIGQGGGSR